MGFPGLLDRRGFDCGMEGERWERRQGSGLWVGPSRSRRVIFKLGLGRRGPTGAAAAGDGSMTHRRRRRIEPGGHAWWTRRRAWGPGRGGRSARWPASQTSRQPSLHSLFECAFLNLQTPSRTETRTLGLSDPNARTRTSTLRRASRKPQIDAGKTFLVSTIGASSAGSIGRRSQLEGCVQTVFFDRDFLAAF